MTTVDMEACMKAGTPGEAHKKLDQFAGTWKAAVRHWMEPGSQPMESTGTMKNTWVLGNRFLRQDYKSDSVDMPFEGTGYFGYNNITGNYEGFWIDTMTTGMMTETGSLKGRTWTMSGEAEFPTAGSKFEKRSVITVDGPDRHKCEMYFKGPDGNEFKTMEIEYKR